MGEPERTAFALSLPNRAVVLGFLTVDQLLGAAEAADASGQFAALSVGDNLLELLVEGLVASCPLNGIVQFGEEERKQRRKELLENFLPRRILVAPPCPAWSSCCLSMD